MTLQSAIQNNCLLFENIIRLANEKTSLAQILHESEEEIDRNIIIEVSYPLMCRKLIMIIIFYRM